MESNVGTNTVRVVPVLHSVRAWALAGIVAALGGVGGVVLFQDEGSLAGQDTRLRVCAALGMIGVAGLVVFVSGLRAYMDEQTPVGSMTGRIAQCGGLIAATTLFVGYLLKLIVAGYTDKITGAADLVVRNGLDNLSTGAWAALALMMLAVSVAAIRHAALPRWLGWLSGVLGSLIAVATVAGAPQAGFLAGAAWLLVASASMLRARGS
ncbi:MAG: hypothetical protein J2P43_00615 [Candidatus Dormibacteraeota bacterium]|nr:hypothetical protein [Candidatus Dormibacteraeota bacterium]